MWLMTEYGFFSIVCGAAQSPDGKRKTLDQNCFMVRARVRDHLVRIMAAAELPERIFHSKETDYPFRVFLNPRQFALIMSIFMRSVKYGNFKNHIAGMNPPHVPEYLEMLHDVWEIGYHVGNSVLSRPADA